MVSSYNTTDLHLKLLRLFSGCATSKETKRVVNYMDCQQLLEGIRIKHSIENVTCYDWIQHSCEFKPEFLLSIDQFMILLYEITQYFESKKENTTLSLCGNNVDLTKAVDYFRFQVNLDSQYSLSKGPEIKELCSTLSTRPDDSGETGSDYKGNMIDTLKAMTYKDVNKD